MSKTSIVALMHGKETFTAALNGIMDGLGSEYDITICNIDKLKDITAINDLIIQTAPQALIIMDVNAIKLCEELQIINKDIQSLPKFLLMTLQAEQSSRNLKNICGVKFEVPAYMLITQFRFISEKDFSRVGIFYRKYFTETFEESQRLLKKEKIELIGICIDCEESDQLTEERAASIMKKRTKELISKSVDVFWIPADNLIINLESYVQVWKPIKYKKYPVLVPLENLANLQTNLGIYAAIPSFSDLGAQVANQIIEHFERGVSVNDIGLEPLIDVKSVINSDVAKSIGWKIKFDGLSEDSKVLGQIKK
jgi:hypothetical protein